MSTLAADRPAIILVAPAHSDILADEFRRYARDYDVVAAPSVREAKRAAKAAIAADQPVALFVIESRLPDSELYAAIAHMREGVPTARRLVVSHVSTFADDSPMLADRDVHGQDRRPAAPPPGSA